MKLRKASIIERLKAGIVDMFMIMMPVQYFMTYFIAGSAAEYRSSQALVLAAGLIYLGIIFCFFIFSDQTPGYKYIKLHLRASDGKRVSLLALISRIVVWLVSFALLFGLIFPFFRKDRAFLHDLFSGTLTIKEIE